MSENLANAAEEAAKGLKQTIEHHEPFVKQPFQESVQEEGYTPYTETVRIGETLPDAVSKAVDSVPKGEAEAEKYKTFEEALRELTEARGLAFSVHSGEFRVREGQSRVCTIQKTGGMSWCRQDVDGPAIQDYIRVLAEQKFQHETKPVGLSINEKQIQSEEARIAFFRNSVSTLLDCGIEIERIQIHNKDYRYLLDEFRPKQAAEVGLDEVSQDGPKVEPEGVKPKAEPSRREGLSSKLDADEDLLGLGIKKPSTGSISENPYDNIDYGSLSLNPRTPEPAATKVESQAFKQEEAFSLSKDDLLEDVSFNDVFGHLKTDPVFSPALHGAKEVVKETLKDEKKEEKKEAVNPVIKNQDQIDKVMKELDKDKAVADSVKERKRKKYLSKRHSV